jgi:hypothetical protein
MENPTGNLSPTRTYPSRPPLKGIGLRSYVAFVRCWWAWWSAKRLCPRGGPPIVTWESSGSRRPRNSRRFDLPIRRYEGVIRDLTPAGDELQRLQGGATVATRDGGSHMLNCCPLSPLVEAPRQRRDDAVPAGCGEPRSPRAPSRVRLPGEVRFRRCPVAEGLMDGPGRTMPKIQSRTFPASSSTFAGQLT